MKLNWIEKALMTNAARGYIQRRFEGPLLERLGGRLDGMSVLEIGSGCGFGTEVLLDQLGAASVHAVDLDPEMVARARRRLSRFASGRLCIEVGDATNIPAAPASYDAVVDFMIIHHVSAWREAVAEVARVLKPGGLFLFEEVTRRALDRWFYRTFLDHPTADRFSAAELVDEIERQGIAVAANVVERFHGDFVIGAGRRVADPIALGIGPAVTP